MKKATLLFFLLLVIATSILAQNFSSSNPNS